MELREDEHLFSLSDTIRYFAERNLNKLFEDPGAPAIDI